MERGKPFSLNMPGRFNRKTFNLWRFESYPASDELKTDCSFTTVFSEFDERQRWNEI